MTKIALVTDSSCDIPAEWLQKWNIEVVPFRIVYKEQEYRDGVEIKPNEIYDRLQEEIPTTSMPSPEDVLSTFTKLKEEGYTHCIVIAVSSAMSNTYNNFRLLAEEFEGMKIDVIDSKALSWVLGFMVMETAQMIREKLDYQEILDQIGQARERIKGYFTIETLEYLKAGGRIGKVTATLGTMLNLKPIITLDDDGRFTPFTIARGRKQSLKKLMEPIVKQLETTKANIAIFQGRAEKEAEMLKEKLKEFENVCELTITSVGPALGVHTGPGLLGLAINPLVRDQ